MKNLGYSIAEFVSEDNAENEIPTILEKQSVDEFVLAPEKKDDKALLHILYSLYSYKRPVKILAGDLSMILEGNLRTIPQDELFDKVEELHPAPKIFKDTCRINWHQPMKQIYDYIRGLSPYPAAWTELEAPGDRRQVLKIYETEIRFAEHEI